MTDNMAELYEEEQAGRKMMVGRIVQNVQVEARAKGKPMGVVSANQILEMADRGESQGFKSVESLRQFLRLRARTRN